jgi:hypothetical protein
MTRITKLNTNSNDNMIVSVLVYMLKIYYGHTLRDKALLIRFVRESDNTSPFGQSVYNTRISMWCSTRMQIY